MPLAFLLRQPAIHVQASLQNPDAPYSSIDYGSKNFPSFGPQSSTTCNVDLPTSTTVDRYLYVVEYYISQVPSLSFWCTFSGDPCHHLQCPILFGHIV